MRAVILVLAVLALLLVSSAEAGIELALVLDGLSQPLPGRRDSRVLPDTSRIPPAGVVGALSADARTFPPLQASDPVPAGLDLADDGFVTFTFSGAEPPGTYTVFVALARLGAFGDGRPDPGDLWTVATRAFTVAP